MSIKRKRTPRQLADLAECRARELEARLRATSVRAAMKAQRAMLATYAAADRGRKNKDWRASSVSADQAIIPDDPLLNARARQMVRDSWVAQSAVSAFTRNVIGCGIIPVPQIKTARGKLNADMNRNSMLDFWTWASDRLACDVECDQTFWQMQSLAETERATVGEAFIIWSYEPSLLQNGLPDTSRPVGLKLQAFEAEQLDTTIFAYTDANNVTREVRGGLELDDRGVTVAYHVFSRNPNDYTFRQTLRSQRIPAERVFHYYRKRRVRQKRGVTDLAPVLQDMRDVSRYKDANLWRAIMEACIGMMVKRDPAIGGSAFAGLQPPTAGDTGTTPSGLPKIDWIPGMVAAPPPGTSLEPYIPQAPGNQYEPFTRQTLRGIGAGAGISYGQVSRDFTQGTYSGQRQEMLEDRKEFEPLQELAAHNLILPIFRIFLSLSIMEGRYGRDVTRDYASAPQRYMAAEYVAPPPVWIDPLVEAEAMEKLIEMRVISREEIAHMRGYRLADILEKISDEKKESDALGITFDENVEAEATLAKAKAELTSADAQKISAEASKSKNTKLPVIGNEQLGAITKSDIAPNYRIAAEGEAQRCGTCRYSTAGKCSAYEFTTTSYHACNAWELTDFTDSRRTPLPPVKSDGNPGIDHDQGDFTADVVPR